MNKPKRIEHLVNVARHYRDQMNAMSVEFVKLHDVEPGSCDADDLISVIYDGFKYDEAMRRIINRKLNAIAEKAEYRRE